MHDRKDKEEPICKKSKTDILDPKREIANTDIDEPHLPNDLNDIADPKCK